VIETKADLLRKLRHTPPDWLDWPEWKRRLWEKLMKPAIAAVEELPDDYQQEVPN
jgi:hypothetical protein